ncbi:MAG: helix-turn-helix domain-containing protein, partial [Gammaproteobacteria bacterium]|nr:helix-turn-helix domain-containing protein [Gammaproteobacteria bacterium]
MSAGENNAKNEPRPTGIGPGDRLQAARIQQGMSLDDVADRMHLSPAILEAIEENNFEEITAPIFVKGYLRAYARIVALDEDEMIQQYIDFYSEEDPPISSTSNMAPELSANDVRIKWTTYLV